MSYRGGSRGRGGRGSARGGGGSARGRGGRGGYNTHHHARGGGGYHGPSTGIPVSYDDDAFFAGTQHHPSQHSRGPYGASADPSLYPLSYADTSSFQLPSAAPHKASHHAPQQQPYRPAAPQQQRLRPQQQQQQQQHLQHSEPSLLGDAADYRYLASLTPHQRAAELERRAEELKASQLRAAHEQLDEHITACASAYSQQLSSGKTFSKPAKGSNAHPTPRTQSIQFRDDLAADAAAAAESKEDDDEEYDESYEDEDEDDEDEEDEDEEEQYDDGEEYNDEDTIFDYAEQIMMDGKQAQAKKQLQQQQQEARQQQQQHAAPYGAGKKTAGGKKQSAAFHPPPENQRPVPAARSAPAPVAANGERLTHSQERALRRAEKAAYAAGLAPPLQHKLHQQHEALQSQQKQQMQAAADAPTRELAFELPTAAHPPVYQQRNSAPAVAAPAPAAAPGFSTPQRATHSHNNVAPSSSGSAYRSHGGGGHSFFPEHLAPAILEAGLRNGLYVKGILRIIGSNAFVTVAGLKTDVFIEGRKGRNRAFDGDEVCVQIGGDAAGGRPAHGSTPQRLVSKQGYANNSNESASKQSKHASMSASLANLISASSAAEDEKIAAERAQPKSAAKPAAAAHAAVAAPVPFSCIMCTYDNAASASKCAMCGCSRPAVVVKPAPAVAPAVAASAAPAAAAPESESRLRSVEPSSPAAAAYLAHLSSLPTQQKGVVLGILRPKYPTLHAPGLLKPYSEHMALFVPLDRKTPFAMLAESRWPEGFARKYKEYLAAEKQKKDERTKGQRSRKEKGNFPLSEQNSSDVCVEHDELQARARAASASEGSVSEAEIPSEPREVDAMTAASDSSIPLVDDHIYVAVFDPWRASDRQPFCSIESTLGLSGAIAAETEALLIANGVDYDFEGKFSPEVLAEVAAYSAASNQGGGRWQIPAEEIAKRRDMRDQTQWRIVSIDPTTARDLDDAIHVKLLEDEDTVEIGVHIADVSRFVSPGTKLDEAARHRATTIYLVNKAIPMLPPILCEQLCSLNPNEDRLAYSTVFYLSLATGKLVTDSDKYKTWFGRTVIRTCARLNYETAQELMAFELSSIRAAGREVTYGDLGGDLAKAMAPGSPYRPVDVVSLSELMGDMQLLHKVSMRRRADRFEQGSLTLTNVKLQFLTDSERNPTGFFAYEYRDSNRVVEECMLLANQVVAHQIAKFCKSIALLRRHPPPQDNGMSRVSAACAELGFEIDASSSGALQKSLAAYEGRFVGSVHGVNDVEITPGTVPLRLLLEPMCTKPMQLAQYFCTGALDDPKEWEHFALHFAEYTHFTSPIRRYADVIVHRILTLSLEVEAWETQRGASAKSAGRPRPDASLSTDEVMQIADWCNTRKANAKKAQEASSKLYLCDFLQRHYSASTPLSASAVIIDMLAPEGSADPTFVVLIPEMGIEKTVHIMDLLKQKKVIAATIEPKDAPAVNSRNNNNNAQQRSGSAAPPASSVSAVAAAAPVSTKAQKRLTVQWIDGTSNTYAIFDSIFVELLVRRGPPMDVDAAVISPAVAQQRQQASKEEEDAKLAAKTAPAEPAVRVASPLSA